MTGIGAVSLATMLPGRAAALPVMAIIALVLRDICDVQKVVNSASLR